MWHKGEIVRRASLKFTIRAGTFSIDITGIEHLPYITYISHLYLKISENPQEKNMCHILYFNKAAGSVSVKFTNFFKNTIFVEHDRTAVEAVIRRCSSK